MIKTIDPKVFRKGSCHRSGLVSDLLVHEHLNERVLSILLRQPNCRHLKRCVWVHWRRREDVAEVGKLGI